MSVKSDSHISFYMPAYNAEKTIIESVDSIINGNFEDGDELIIVDDGSTDSTLNIIRELQTKYPGIKILKHSRNKGGGAARNTAIENAKNEILFCLDSDNILVPESIKKLKSFMIESQADIAAFQEIHFFINDINNVTNKWVFKTGLFTLTDYLTIPQSFGPDGNYMFTKTSWIKAGGFPEFAGAIENWGFALYLLATNHKAYIMPNTYYLHRHGHQSYWVRNYKKGKISLTALQIIIPYLHLLHEEDVDYIMSREGRYSWFDNLDKRPLRLKSES